MRRLSIEGPKASPNFIGAWMIDKPEICDDLVNYFEENKAKQKKGIVGDRLNQEIKKTTDITVDPNELDYPKNAKLKEYIENLYSCYCDYLSQWPFLGELTESLEIGPFALVKYDSGGHFNQVHTERASLATLQRVLVWMTYLNDMDCSGETYFSHYDISIKPKKGLTLIWPAEWTHAHRGNKVEAGPKYMISGWMHFPN